MIMASFRLGLVVWPCAVALSCGSSVSESERMTVDGSSGSDAGAASSSTGASSDGEASDATAPTDSSGGGCVPLLSVSPWVRLTDQSLGMIRILDMDQDGRSDLVGGRGVLLLDRETDFEVQIVPDFPSTNSASPGEFGGDDRLDLMAVEFGRLSVFLAAGLDGAPPVSTTTPVAWSHAVGDLNDDGIWDVVLLREGGVAVETWYGTPTGLFEKAAEIEMPASSVGVIRLEFGQTEVAFSDRHNIRFFTSYADNSLVESYIVPAGGVYWLEPLETLDRDEVLYLSFLDNGLESEEGVGVLSLVNRDFTARWHAFERGRGLAGQGWGGGDLNGDGRNDVVVSVWGAETGYELELLCSVGDDLLKKCGASPLEYLPESLRVMSGDTVRIVYSTADDGAWIASVATVDSCE